MFRQTYLVAIAFALLAFFVAPSLPQPWMTGACFALGAGLSIGAVVAHWRSKRRDRYSLAALRELHESGGSLPDEDDLPEIEEDANVMCPHCGTVYGSWLPICPHCRR